MRTVSGSEAKVLIESQLAAHGNDVLSVLAQYWRDEAVAAWMRRSKPLRSFSICRNSGSPTIGSELGCVRSDLTTPLLQTQGRHGE